MATCGKEPGVGGRVVGRDPSGCRWSDDLHDQRVHSDEWNIHIFQY